MDAENKLTAREWVAVRDQLAAEILGAHNTPMPRETANLIAEGLLKQDLIDIVALQMKQDGVERRSARDILLGPDAA